MEALDGKLAPGAEFGRPAGACGHLHTTVSGLSCRRSAGVHAVKEMHRACNSRGHCVDAMEIVWMAVEILGIYLVVVLDLI
jgi:hypothetical protein